MLDVLDFRNLDVFANNNFELEYTLDNEIDNLKILVEIENEEFLAKEISVGDLLKKGTHIYRWDGLIDDYFHTKMAKVGKVYFLVNNVTKVEIETIHTRSVKNWVDLAVNNVDNKIKLTVYPNVKIGGIYGIGQTISQNNPPQITDVNDFPNSQELLDLAREGIEYYYSRDVTINNVFYEVKSTAVFDSSKGMDVLELKQNTNRKSQRSFNGTFLKRDNDKDLIPILSLIKGWLIGEVWYQLGWVNYSTGWTYIIKEQADLRFSKIFAHELGHNIIYDMPGGGWKYSLTHKGTSSYLQSTNSNSHYPTDWNEEIDLMKYYNGTPLRSAVFAEEDLIGLMRLGLLK